MPIYEFECKDCDHCFERLVFVDDDRPVKCPRCDSARVKKLVSCASFIGASGLAGCGPGSGKGFS
ncbi:MAG: zinc ribbon domain-containing protein [Deltaproteobacteria bacterium]|nr:zinc ribbon domain-containing protein [Deltaproteobacteria bacterium]MBW1956346.1 zinc ribbon domain-containing protein [Deltaproteobacteria bacterium]MBW2040813.1 zinc ribbon domain-containing protein [Deltaproteobacteria bacterium]MBW2131217.1 zinc ribbon domain-containing protein [Deltaproteobacteria bacterium]